MTHHIGVHEGEDAVTIIIGIDPHKATHTAVAIDETEQALAELQLAADRCQTMRLLAWAARSRTGRGRWSPLTGSASCWPSASWPRANTSSTSQPPLPPRCDCSARRRHRRMTPTTPCRPRSPGYDTVDCAAWSPMVTARRSGCSCVASVISRPAGHRRCRLHAVLIELIPGGMPRKLKAEAASTALRKVRTDNPVDIARKQLAADLVLDVRRCDRELHQLRERIADAVDASGTTLLEVYGVGPIVAALILGYAGDPARFGTKEKFAAYNGTAPIEASSGPKARHRLNPRGTGS